MNLNSLKPATGSVKGNIRKGRGVASGKGGTSTRGHKGAKSRSGYSKKVGFEGGQMPLQRRVPKFGFKSLNRVEYKVLNLDSLETLASQYKLTEVNFDSLVEHGLVGRNDLVKILGRGELKTKLTVEAHKFSLSAKTAIESIGGEAKSI
jgi:large subunit ribosomal protein L15